MKLTQLARQVASSVLLPILVASTFFACGREPKSYQDCILTKVKEGMNEAAVRAVTQACAMKFAQDFSMEKAAPLKLEDLVLLDGRGGISFGNHFAGTIYNRLQDRSIAELNIGVSTTSAGVKTTKVYAVDVSIKPRSAGDFGFDLIVGDNGGINGWRIVGAKATK